MGLVLTLSNNHSFSLMKWNSAYVFYLCKIAFLTLCESNPPVGGGSPNKGAVIRTVCPYFVMTWWRHQMETFSAILAFVRGIHRSPVNTLPKGQWRGPFRFSLICAWINGWVNNREAGDLRRHRTNYDVVVMEAVMSLGWPGLAGRYRWRFYKWFTPIDPFYDLFAPCEKHNAQSSVISYDRVLLNEPIPC